MECLNEQTDRQTERQTKQLMWMPLVQCTCVTTTLHVDPLPFCMAWSRMYWGIYHKKRNIQYNTIFNVEHTFSYMV